MIEVIECSSAEEFLEKISPSGVYFKSAKISSPWIFRGQGNMTDLYHLFSAKEINLEKSFKS